MNKEQWEVIALQKRNIVQRYADSKPPEGHEKGWVWLVWEYYGWAFLAKNGAELRGFNLSQRYGEWLMVVKALVDDTPVVAFMSAMTTTGCVEKVLDRLDEGTLKFTPDRYA